MLSKRFERGQWANTFSIDLKHWLFGVNWGTETLFDGRKHFLGIHLGPFCYVLSWPASGQAMLNYSRLCGLFFWLWAAAMAVITMWLVL